LFISILFIVYFIALIGLIVFYYQHKKDSGKKKFLFIFAIVVFICAIIYAFFQIWGIFWAFNNLYTMIWWILGWVHIVAAIIGSGLAIMIHK